MTTRWDPAQYDRYKAWRERPANDLIAQIPADLQPREVWDLGCGTGEQAALFKRRWPDATVHGLDTSPDMLAKGRARPEAVDWVEGDAATWTPERPADLIFTNAALQWLPDHAGLFPRLAGFLAPGGVLACQMPVSYVGEQHRLLRETAVDGPWAGRLAGVAGVRPLGEPADYYDWLAPVCAQVDVWTTTYLHALEGEDAVLEWMAGTGLRPYLQAFSSETERATFLDAYRARLSRAFPRRADGTTLFAFQRLFLVARARS